MAGKRKIREGGRGGSRLSAENIIPTDAKRLSFQTESFEFFVHKSHGHTTLYIQTTAYHPGILEVPVEKLVELIKYLESWNNLGWRMHS